MWQCRVGNLNRYELWCKKMNKTPSGGDHLSASSGEESATVLVSRIFVTVVTLGTQSLLAWGLAPQGRGAYAVCLVFSMLLGVFFIMGCDRASQHFTMSGGLSLSQSVSVALTCTAVGSVFGMAVGWFLVDLPWSFSQMRIRRNSGCRSRWCHS